MVAIEFAEPVDVRSIDLGVTFISNWFDGGLIQGLVFIHLKFQYVSNGAGDKYQLRDERIAFFKIVSVIRMLIRVRLMYQLYTLLSI